MERNVTSNYGWISPGPGLWSRWHDGHIQSHSILQLQQNGRQHMQTIARNPALTLPQVDGFGNFSHPFPLKPHNGHEIVGVSSSLFVTKTERIDIDMISWCGSSIKFYWSARLFYVKHVRRFIKKPRIFDPICCCISFTSYFFSFLHLKNYLISFDQHLIK